MHCAARTCLLAACAALAAPARADAPLFSETADVIGADACQMEAASSRAKARGQAALRAWDLLASCGIGGHSQLAAGANSELAQGQRTQALRAFGKTTLIAPETGRTGYGLRYGASAEKAASAGWRSKELELLGVLTRAVAPQLLFHANLGHVHSRGPRQGSTVWSLGMETVADTTLAADIFGDDRSRPWASAGLGHKVGRGFSVNACAAVQFERPRVQALTLGAKLEF